MASNSYPTSMSYGRPQPVGSQTALPYQSNSRSNFATSHGWIPEDLNEPYSLSPPQYNLSAQDPQLPSVNYTSPEVSRAWVPIPTSRQPQQSFNLDQDLSTKYTTPSLPLPSATCTIGAPEGHSQFPAMNTLKTSLPTYPLHNSRILPVPDGKRGSTRKGHTNTSALMLDDCGTGALQSLNYRSTGMWNPAHTATEGNQHSAGSSTSSTVSGTEGVSSNSSSSPQKSHKTTSFGYRQAQQDRDTDCNASYSLSSTASMRRHTAIDSSIFPGELSSNNVLPDQDTSPSQYTYNLGSSTENPKGTLVNGESYTRLQEPHHAQSYEALNHLTGQTNTFPTHRTSLSNARPQ